MGWEMAGFGREGEGLFFMGGRENVVGGQACIDWVSWSVGAPSPLRYVIYGARRSTYIARYPCAIFRYILAR